VQTKRVIGINEGLAYRECIGRRPSLPRAPVAVVLFDVPVAVDLPTVSEREERAGMNRGELEGRVSADWIMSRVAEASCRLPLFPAHAATCPLCAHPGLSPRKRPSRAFLRAQNLFCFENRAMHAKQSAQATIHSLFGPLGPVGRFCGQPNTPLTNYISSYRLIMLPN
jgi:hypothetical protein